MSREEWRAVPGFEDYEVSDLGRVRSWRMPGAAAGTRRERPETVVGCSGGAGYRLIHLRGSNGKRFAYVHRLVLEGFRGACPQGMECRHLNGDKTDNRLANLAWGTAKENASDKINHGTFAAGSKLSADDVREIRLLRSAWPGNVVASWFGITQPTVCDITKGRTWRHIA